MYIRTYVSVENIHIGGVICAPVQTINFSSEIFSLRADPSLSI